MYGVIITSRPNCQVAETIEFGIIDSIEISW